MMAPYAHIFLCYIALNIMHNHSADISPLIFITYYSFIQRLSIYICSDFIVISSFCSLSSHLSIYEMLTISDCFE